MRNGLIGGAGLGALEFSWQVLSASAFGATPWFIPIAFGLEVGFLIALLGRGAGKRTWGGQFKTGAIASTIGAVLVFVGSLIVSQALFPTLLATLGPIPPTPIDAAGGGFMGTWVSGLGFSAAWGYVTRQRTARSG